MKEKVVRARRGEIAPADRAWFDRTCRVMARVGCRGRPDLWEDAEAEARLSAWRAYRDGKDPGIVAAEARKGAWALWRAQGALCRRADLWAAPLTVPGEHGERDNPALYPAALAASPWDAVIARLSEDAGAGAGARREERTEALRAAVASLPPLQRAAVAGVCAGRSPADIAAETGAARQSVYRSYDRGIRRLRRSPEVAALCSPEVAALCG